MVRIHSCPCWTHGPTARHCPHEAAIEVRLLVCPLGSEGWRSSLPHRAPNSIGRVPSWQGGSSGFESRGRPCALMVQSAGRWPSKPEAPVRIWVGACGQEVIMAIDTRLLTWLLWVRIPPCPWESFGIPSAGHCARAWESPQVGVPGCYPGRGRFESFPRRWGNVPQYTGFRGPLAQLAERVRGMDEVPGSNPGAGLPA